MVSSQNFESIKTYSQTINEDNNNDTNADEETKNRGLFIIPSINVPDRTDITGFVLSAVDNSGKVEWTSNSQSLPPSLESIANLTTTQNNMLYTTGANNYETTSISPLGRSFVGLITTSEQRSQLGLEIGVDVQGYSQSLDTIVSITGVNDRIPYTVGGSYSSTSLTSYARNNLLNAPDSATLATNLGYITPDGDFSSNITSIPKIETSSSIIPSGLTIDASDNLTVPGTINDVTNSELQQIANIDSIIITNSQWGFLGNMDQNINSTSTPTFDGLNASGGIISNLGTPSNATDATTKIYVDTIASTGAPPLESVNYATANILPDTPTYTSGTQILTSVGGPGSLDIDSQTVSVGDRILVKNQLDSRENGIYIVTDDGATPGPNWVITRSTDFDQSVTPILSGSSVFVQIVAGASNSAATFSLETTVNTIDPLTDDVNWVQVGGSPSLVAGQGINSGQLTSGTIEIENTARFTFSGNELELNTVNVPFGGTGQTTLTSNGVLIGQGTSNVNTSKQAPTGDFLGTTDTQTLTNKTLTDSTNNIASRSLHTDSGSNQVSTFASANPTVGQVLTATSGSTATWQDPSATAIVEYAKTIFVSPSNPGTGTSLTTIADAITAAIALVPTITEQVAIIVYPGEYVENTPLTIPSFVTLMSQTDLQNYARIVPAAPAAAGPVIILENQSRVYGILIDGDDGSGGNATVGIQSILSGSAINYIASVTVQNCTDSGILIQGDGTQFSNILSCRNISILVTQTFPFEMEYGIRVTQGAVLSGRGFSVSGFLSGGGVLVNAIGILNDFSYADLSNVSISSVTNGYTVGSGVSSNYLSDYSRLRITGGTIGLYSGRGFNLLSRSNVFIASFTIDDDSSIFTSQIPVYVENPSKPSEPNNAVANGFIFRVDRSSFTNGASDNIITFVGEYINILETEPQTNIVGTFSVGNPLVGFEFIAGEGNSHTFGMQVLMDDGGVFSDVTSNLKFTTSNVTRLNTDLATTASIDLTSAPATIDGVAPTLGVSRILVKDGSTANPGTISVDNGIYLWNGVGLAMTRTADFNTGEDFPNNTTFSVNDGDTNYRSQWKLVNNRITVGTTSFSLEPFTTTVFPVNPQNDDALYIGSLIPKIFAGIKVFLTAPIVLSSGNVTDALVWEFWNGTEWTELTLMVTLADANYTGYRNRTFAETLTIDPNTSLSFQYRFSSLATWVTNEVNGVTGYWVRCRVIDSTIITQVPVIEQIKLHTRRTEINKDGFMEYFSLGRAIKRKSFTTGEAYINNLYTNPGNENITYAIGTDFEIRQTTVDCQFNDSTTSCLGWNFLFPIELDTSRNMRVIVTFMQEGIGVGDVALQFDYTYVVQGDVLDTGSPTPPAMTTGIQAFPVDGAEGGVTQISMTFDVQTIPQGAFFLFQLRRLGADLLDTYSNIIYILNVTLEYTIWCNGKYLLADS